MLTEALADGPKSLNITGTDSFHSISLVGFLDNLIHGNLQWHSPKVTARRTYAFDGVEPPYSRIAGRLVILCHDNNDESGVIS